MGGKGGGGSGDTTVRFAPYVEAAHQQMVNHNGADSLTLSVFQAMNAAVGQSPYDNIDTITAEAGFLGGGSITSRRSSFDMFQMIMLNTDIKALWLQLYEDSVDNPEVAAAVTSQGALIQDEIDTRIMPKFLAGMRDINAVQSTTFGIGKALIAESQVKLVHDFSSKLKLKQCDVALERWAKHLAWNTSLVSVYNDMMKMYYTARFDAESREMEYAVKDALWDLSLFEYGRSTIAALNGAAAASPQNQPSQTAKGIAGAMAGAGAGAAIGAQISKDGGAAWGAAAGGLLGLAASFL